MSSAIARYESFLLNNGSTISTLESSLRSLTWFLPGRFKDAELASEALSAFLNLMSLYHDTLLSRLVHADPKFRPLIPLSAHARYTRSWADKDARYKWASRFLEIIRFLELVIEMGLRRKASVKNRWRVIVLLELVKATLRLTILRITRRLVLSPPIPERDFDPTNMPSQSNTSSPTPVPSSQLSSPSSTPAHLKNNHITLEAPNSLFITPPLPSQSDSPVDDYLLSKALSASSVKSPTALVRPLSSPKDWISEVLYIIRPLIYVGALSTDRESSNPLIISLAMELLSRYFRRTPPPSSVLERSEYARRDRDILWYIVRGSIWKSYTRPKLESFADRTATAPLLGLISAFVKDWIPLIDEYYYYTAT